MGCYFGIILIVEKLILLKWLNKAPAAVGHLYSLVLIILGWVIFGLTDFGQMKDYIVCMFGGGNGWMDSDFQYLAISRIWLLIACTIGSTPLVKILCAKICGRIGNETAVGVLESVVLLGIFGLSVAFLVSGSYNPFLYFRF